MNGLELLYGIPFVLGFLLLGWWIEQCRHIGYGRVKTYTRCYLPGFPDEGSVQYHCSNCGRKVA